MAAPAPVVSPPRAQPSAGAVVLSAGAFAERMADLGPFENRPHVAVAVSGGADSLCLVLLADAWARARGGRVTALTVDHGLRAAAADEARTVAGWLAARAIDHHILKWQGDKPSSGIQAAARAARYGLMEAWCRNHGVLHLLLGHHGDDQAETYLMRRAHGSGPDGLAAMAAVTESGAVRRLRPLLSVPSAALRASLQAMDHPWIEDPSNRDRRFERVRVRQDRAQDLENGLGLDTPAVLTRVARFAAVRTERDARTSILLARYCSVDPAGFVRLSVAAVQGDMVPSVMARVLMTVGGNAYPPDRDKVLRAAAQAADGRAGALAGCCWHQQGGLLTMWREGRNLPKAQAVKTLECTPWDRRFRVEIQASDTAGLVLAPLGEDGWLQVGPAVADAVKARIPHAARLTLPALWRGGGVSVVPGLGYNEGAAVARMTAVFRPSQPLGRDGFCSTLQKDGCVAGQRGYLRG